MLIAFNKPFGVICRFRPEPGRPTLADYIKTPGVYPAGRLDTDSEGLLLLTDDGALQARGHGVDAVARRAGHHADDDGLGQVLGGGHAQLPSPLATSSTCKLSCGTVNGVSSLSQALAKAAVNRRITVEANCIFALRVGAVPATAYARQKDGSRLTN